MHELKRKTKGSREGHVQNVGPLLRFLFMDLILRWGPGKELGDNPDHGSFRGALGNPRGQTHLGFLISGVHYPSVSVLLVSSTITDLGSVLSEEGMALT